MMPPLVRAAFIHLFLATCHDISHPFIRTNPAKGALLAGRKGDCSTARHDEVSGNQQMSYQGKTARNHMPLALIAVG
jgi:hypothetical protein